MTKDRPKVAFCRTCNARERSIVDGRCIVCGQDPKARPQEDDQR